MAPTVYTPPVGTYTALATVTLASTDSEIVFSSIPATYRDLVLVIAADIDALTIPYMTINGQTGTSFYYGVSARAYSGTSYASSSKAGTEGYMRLKWQSSDAVGQVNYIVQLLDANATDKHKLALIRQNDPNGELGMQAHRMATTSAISSMNIFSGSNPFGIGTTISLYGIEA